MIGLASPAVTLAAAFGVCQMLSKTNIPKLCMACSKLFDDACAAADTLPDACAAFALRLSAPSNKLAPDFLTVTGVILLKIQPVKLPML